MNRPALSLVAPLLASLILAAAVPSASAQGAPRGICSLTPIGPEDVEVVQAEPGLVAFRAEWSAITSCPNPNHPLHGETAWIRHDTLVRGVGGGALAGQTSIVIEFPGAGFSASLAGRARGPIACAPELCSLALEVRANGDGVTLVGDIDLTFDPQGISVPNQSSKLDFRVTPGGAP